ncbi:MAG TPA: hypothetical protein VG817_07785 [Gemmatimonadales bacterium]|nr:hypothetical protein [Gemmatimonadales bacterium]
MLTASIIRRFLLLALLVLAAACGSDDGNDETKTLEIAIHDGDGQSGTVGTALLPYHVSVTDLEGNPQDGVTVTWSVVSGGGAVSEVTATTDGDGLTSAVATLGTTAGVQVVRAAAGGDVVQFSSTGTAGAAAAIAKVSGDGQRSAKHAGLLAPVIVKVTDQYHNPVAGASVDWIAAAGNGMPSAVTTTTTELGTTQVTWTLGPTAGGMALKARLAGADSVSFTATASGAFTVLGGGNNVPERYGSDQWVADGYAYSGSWGFRNAQGNTVKIWQLDADGAPILKDSIVTPNVGTISDIEISPDGKWLVFTGESGTNRGIHVYELTAPGTPVFRAKVNDFSLHTAALSVIGGKLYAFTAKDPTSCALRVYDLSAAGSGTITVASNTPIPDNYCIHDTFVRDGLAFVFAWDEGLYIFDVGKGSHGGSPQNPVQISHTTGFGGQTHNGWWFWNPNGEKKYLFIGEEGPGAVGASSSGDIHVVDVSNLAAPVEVATYNLAGAGVHNFWMDEARQILYAAYYNGGVVALDVSGTLSGNLANREIAIIKPGGGGNTYVWGVMLYNNSLYATDMLSGFWQLGVP